MAEQYSFTARIAERWPNLRPTQLQIVPDDWDAFEAYIQRTGITTDIGWHPNHYVTVSTREFVARAENVGRVRYTIQPLDCADGRRIRAIDLEPIA
jgi:hypothetical protein